MRLEKISWIAGIISAGLAAVGIIIPLLSNQSSGQISSTNQNYGTTTNQIGTMSGGQITIINPPPQNNDGQKFNIDQILKSNSIGDSIDHLEKMTGPAKSKIKGAMGLMRREYNVDGCKLYIGTTDDGTIESINIPVSNKCSFNWRSMSPPNNFDLPQPNNLKFGDVMRDRDWSVSADCLKGCGNSHDPSTYLRFGGSHADNFLVTVLEAVNDNLINISASSELAQKISNKKGDDFVIMGKYKCDFDLNSAAIGSIEKMKVNSITIRPEYLGYESVVGSNERCKK